MQAFVPNTASTCCFIIGTEPVELVRWHGLAFISGVSFRESKPTLFAEILQSGIAVQKAQSLANYPGTGSVDAQLIWLILFCVIR